MNVYLKERQEILEEVIRFCICFFFSFFPVFIFYFICCIKLIFYFTGIVPK